MLAIDLKKAVWDRALHGSGVPARLAKAHKYLTDDIYSFLISEKAETTLPALLPMERKWVYAHCEWLGLTFQSANQNGKIADLHIAKPAGGFDWSRVPANPNNIDLKTRLLAPKQKKRQVCPECRFTLHAKKQEHEPCENCDDEVPVHYLYITWQGHGPLCETCVPDDGLKWEPMCCVYGDCWACDHHSTCVHSAHTLEQALACTTCKVFI